MAGLEKHYSVRDIEARILAGLRAAGLDPEKRLTPEELAGLDHFHTGGYQSSRRLQDLAKIRAEDRVLDIGAGLAGAARMLAASQGCRVDCVELTSDYCTGADLLNRLTGLGDRVTMYQCSALDLPFPDHSFDVIWMQNVGMNISDKRKLYAEFSRVLRPSGRFAFQEMTAGEAAEDYYFPLPWATDPSDNFLISAEDMHALLGECGFVPEFFEDATDTILNGPAPGAPPPPTPQIQLGLSVYVDDLTQKRENADRSLDEGQIRFVRGVFRAN